MTSTVFSQSQQSCLESSFSIVESNYDSCRDTAGSANDLISFFLEALETRRDNAVIAHPTSTYIAAANTALATARSKFEEAEAFHFNEIWSPSVELAIPLLVDDLRTRIANFEPAIGDAEYYGIMAEIATIETWIATTYTRLTIYFEGKHKTANDAINAAAEKVVDLENDSSN